MRPLGARQFDGGYGWRRAGGVVIPFWDAQGSQGEYVERIVVEVCIKRDEEVGWTMTTKGIRAWLDCSDTFMWACADGENIEPDEVDSLIACLDEFQHPMGGSEWWANLVWICRKRRRIPMRPYLEPVAPRKPPPERFLNALAAVELWAAT